MSLLRRKLTEVRLVRERDAGMGPETEVTMRLKMERCARLPKESGMGPCRPGMFSMLRVSSWSSSAMAGGSLDVMSRLRRKILVTRPCSLQAAGGAQAVPPGRQPDSAAGLPTCSRTI